MVSKHPLALFAFEGTIARRDTMGLFLAYLVRRFPRAILELPRLSFLAGPWALRLVSNERIKTEILRLFTYVPRDERQNVLAEFHAAEIAPRYLAAARERISWHKKQGHGLVLASATIDLYLKYVKRYLDFDHLLATRVEIDPQPHIVGRNCHGLEKVERMRSEPWFSQIDWPRSWAYSDHYSDLPMLKLVGNPVATNSKRRLRKHAIWEGWDIVDWN